MIPIKPLLDSKLRTTYPPAELKLLAAKFVYEVITDEYTEQSTARYLAQRYDFDWTPEWDALISLIINQFVALLNEDLNALDDAIAEGRIRMTDIA